VRINIKRKTKKKKEKRIKIKTIPRTANNYYLIYFLRGRARRSNEISMFVIIHKFDNIMASYFSPSVGFLSPAGGAPGDSLAPVRGRLFLTRAGPLPAWDLISLTGSVVAAYLTLFLSS